MRMRSDPGPATRCDNRAGVIEEAPGAHSPPAPLRQGSPHLHGPHPRRPALDDLGTDARVVTPVSNVAFRHRCVSSGVSPADWVSGRRSV
jgi:hypothetical protein